MFTRLQPNASRGRDSAAWRLLKTMPGLCRRASSEWINDNGPRLGAAVAFYTLLSLAPTAVLAIAVAAVVYGQEAAQGKLASEIQGLAGPELARTVQQIILAARQSRTGVIATVAGLAMLTFGASSVLVELHDAMNTIWGVPLPVDRSRAATMIRLLKDRSYSFATVLATGFLLLVSLALDAWIGAMRISVPRAATLTLSYLVIAVLFGVLCKTVPDVRLKWSDVAPGAAITAMLFVLGKDSLGLYFAHTSFGLTYGAAGSPMVFLLWIYYSALLLFWGVELNKVYTKTLGSQRDQAR